MNETREDRVAAARARMVELAEKFLDRSFQDLASMREELGRVNAGAGEAMGELRHLAHRMAGTGATLGFEPLSDIALQIEALAEAYAPGAARAESTCTAVAEALDALDSELQRQRGTPR
jgi:chemotaxis protein histidine kinase CheA